MPELIEFSWDERTGEAVFTYEDPKTEIQTVETRSKPLAKPTVTPALLSSYFTDLIFWLKTQEAY